MATKTKLKPCPFKRCGGNAERCNAASWQAWRVHWVQCEQCGARTPSFMTATIADRVWNDRDPLPAAERRVVEAAVKEHKARAWESNIVAGWDSKPMKAAIEATANAWGERVAAVNALLRLREKGAKR